MSTYCTRAELPNFGILASALQPIPTTAQDACLSAASAKMDSYFRQRYGPGMPFTAWDDQVKRCCASLAAFDLMIVRGFNPQAGADMNLGDRARSEEKWLRDVAMQIATPAVTLTVASPSPSIMAPQVYSQTKRGW